MKSLCILLFVLLLCLFAGGCARAPAPAAQAPAATREGNRVLSLSPEKPDACRACALCPPRWIHRPG